jgi:hypothetical protein
MVTPNQARFYWRIIAVFICLVWVIVLLINFVGGLLPSRGLIPLAIRHVFIGMTIIGTGILIYVPLQFYIYAGLCCFWGLISIIDGSGLSGMLMYALGLIFALRMGFFKTRPVFKALMGGFVVMAALLFQIWYGIGHFMGSLLEFLELFIIAGLTGALFHRELSASMKNGEEKNLSIRAFSITDRELRLNRDHFTEGDFVILQMILSGIKYEAIAAKQHMGLSTLKKRVASLFNFLEVQDRVQFLKRYGKHALAWNDRQPEGGVMEQRKTRIVEFHN